MNEEDIRNIFEKAIKDPNVASTLDMDKLIENIDYNDKCYLEHKSLEDIRQEISESIDNLSITTELKITLSNKLIGYRKVEEVYELQKGKYVRWYRLSSNKLMNGGIVVDIKFTDNGTQVLCMSSSKRFIQYIFDECITYQKLSEIEQLILMANNYIKGH